MNHRCCSQYPNLPFKKQGFTLVEILVGITLGTFLMAGVIQLFVGNKKTYKFQDAVAEVQENGRFALDMLTGSIRMANFTGCQLSTATGTTFTTIPVENVVNGNTDWWKNLTTDWSGSLVGYDGDASFPGRAFGTNIADRVANTDAIIALGGEGNYTIDTSSTGTPFVVQQINKPNGEVLEAGGLLIVCNPTRTSLFQATTVGVASTLHTIAHAATSTPAPGNNTGTLFNYLPADSSIADYVPTAFYIGVGSAGGASRSLYQLQLQFGSPDCSANTACMVSQELVEGVEDMQIFYGMGVANGGVVTRFFDATDVASWSYLPSNSSVLSVRINLLLTSLDDNIVEQPQTYIFPNDIGDSEIIRRFKTANDRRVYRTFSTTIGIRNRIR